MEVILKYQIPNLLITKRQNYIQEIQLIEHLSVEVIYNIFLVSLLSIKNQKLEPMSIILYDYYSQILTSNNKILFHQSSNQDVSFKVNICVYLFLTIILTFQALYCNLFSFDIRFQFVAILNNFYILSKQFISFIAAPFAIYGSIYFPTGVARKRLRFCLSSLQNELAFIADKSNEYLIILKCTFIQQCDLQYFNLTYDISNYKSIIKQIVKLNLVAVNKLKYLSIQLEARQSQKQQFIIIDNNFMNQRNQHLPNRYKKFKVKKTFLRKSAQQNQSFHLDSEEKQQTVNAKILLNELCQANKIEDQFQKVIQLPNEVSSWIIHQQLENIQSPQRLQRIGLQNKKCKTQNSAGFSRVYQRPKSSGRQLKAKLHIKQTKIIKKTYDLSIFQENLNLYAPKQLDSKISIATSVRNKFSKNIESIKTTKYKKATIQSKISTQRSKSLVSIIQMNGQIIKNANCGFALKTKNIKQKQKQKQKIQAKIGQQVKRNKKIKDHSLRIKMKTQRSISAGNFQSDLSRQFRKISDYLKKEGYYNSNINNILTNIQK